MAGVRIEILDVEQDQDSGSIVIKTNYSINGVDIQSRYPTLNGKYYWVTRFNTSTFKGMTNPQIVNRIFNDLEKFAESVIASEFFKKDNEALIQSKASALIGLTRTVNTADIKIDDTTIWRVSVDGTKVENP